MCMHTQGTVLVGVRAILPNSQRKHPRVSAGYGEEEVHRVQKAHSKAESHQIPSPVLISACEFVPSVSPICLGHLHKGRV